MLYLQNCLDKARVNNSNKGVMEDKSVDHETASSASRSGDAFALRQSKSVEWDRGSIGFSKSKGEKWVLILRLDYYSQWHD